MAALLHPARRIAIIGGGPGGLALLATLHKRGIPATLYERDAAPSTRSTLGGILDLHWNSGQRALRENGLGPAFDALARYEGDTSVFMTADGTVLGKHATPLEKIPVEERKPEIGRRQLVELLRNAVPPESIKWGHAYETARALENGVHEVSFSNGTKVECDLLVGADGARSRVRALLSPAQPIFTGVTGAELYLRAGVNPEAAALVGEGTFGAVHRQRVIFAQHQGGGDIRTYAWFKAPEDFALPEDGKAAIETLLQYYPEGTWMANLRKLIADADPTSVRKRPIYILPIGTSWPHTPGVTLLGDAAHLKTPAMGEGANHAMLDGLELGVAISEAVYSGDKSKTWEKAVEEYEKVMLERGRESAERTTKVWDMSFADEDLQTSIDKMEEEGLLKQYEA